MHWSRIRHYEDPTGWVRRVAYNQAISWLRRARRQLVDYLPDVAVVGGHHVDAYEHDAPPLLLALRKVDHRDRVVPTLRYVWEYSVEEIAHELSVSPNTAKARLARARRRLAAVAAVPVVDEEVPGRGGLELPAHRRPADPVQEGTSR